MTNSRPGSSPRTALTLPLDGDELARHVPWLRRLAHALVHDDSSADDLVQEALGAALVARRPIGDLRSYLGGVLRRRSLDLARRDMRRRGREVAHAVERPDAEPSVDDTAGRVETMRVVLEELERLPAAQRDAITLRYFDDLRPVEIARRLGVEPGTVRAHLARGLAAVRAGLDRRRGGRAGWTAALAPWFAPTDAPAVPIEHSATPGVTTIVAAATVAATGMAALFEARPQGSPDTEPAGTHGAAAIESVVADLPSLADLGGGDEARRTALPVESIESDLGQQAVAAALERRVQGRVIDARTGEPIPYLELMVRPIVDGQHEDLVDAYWVDTRTGDETELDIGAILSAPSFFTGRSTSQARTVHVVTDAAGRFETRVAIDEDEVAVWTTEDRSPGSMLPRLIRREFPFSGDIELNVGPTFRFAGTPPEGVVLEQVDARFGRDGDPFAKRRVARLREGPRPWVRFPAAVARMRGDGPWPLRLSSPDGFWFAEVLVSRCAGVEPEPVELNFRSTGGIDFVVPARDQGAPVLAGAIRLFGPEPGDTRCVRMSAANRENVAGVRELAPGTYRWSRGALSGDVDVVGGEVARVEVERFAAGESFDAEVLVDARAVSAEAVAAEAFVLVDASDRHHVLYQILSPDATRGDGWWRLRLDRIPDAVWTVVPIRATADIEWEPRSVLLRPGGETPILVARPAGPLATLRVHVVDAATGEPISNARVGIGRVDSLPSTVETTNDEGIAVHTTTPGGTPSLLVVSASDYATEGVRITPDRSGSHVSVELHRGWRAPVRVFANEGLRPAEGIDVVVDGAVAGRTDVDGILWIEAAGPPGLVEVALDTPGFEVDSTPFDASGTSVSGHGSELYFFVRSSSERR
ncbi:MAG: RNA polymerase sigma factor [Planctomycetota bacterium]